MSETLIRAEIAGLLGSITNIGKVYDYERWAADWAVFINLFKTRINNVDQIRGWEIGRKAAQAQYDSNAEELTTHQFVIRGYMGVKDSDATEKVFTALIEAVRAKFRFNFRLNNLCEHAGPVSADLVDTRTFGSVLCHYCELSLPVQELFTPS